MAITTTANRGWNTDKLVPVVITADQDLDLAEVMGATAATAATADTVATAVMADTVATVVSDLAGRIITIAMAGWFTATRVGTTAILTLPTMVTMAVTTPVHRTRMVGRTSSLALR